MEDGSCPYEVLGIEMTATIEEIRKAKRDMSRKYHPDKHMNVSESEKKRLRIKFDALGEAYELLSDETSRAKYDAKLKAKQAAQVRHAKLNEEQRKAREAPSFTLGACGVSWLLVQTHDEQIKRLRAEGIERLEAEQVRIEAELQRAHDASNRRAAEASQHGVLKLEAMLRERSRGAQNGLKKIELMTTETTGTPLTAEAPTTTEADIAPDEGMDLEDMEAMLMAKIAQSATQKQHHFLFELQKHSMAGRGLGFGRLARPPPPPPPPPPSSAVQAPAQPDHESDRAEPTPKPEQSSVPTALASTTTPSPAPAVVKAPASKGALAPTATHKADAQQDKVSTTSTLKPTLLAKRPKLTVAEAFGGDEDEDEDEEEEIPAAMRIRMRNVGSETRTSAGPNSYGKSKRGFTWRTRTWETEAEKLAAEQEQEHDGPDSSSAQ
ncbi:uncharacterized protein MONBRDRAFT_5424 [Monosiga brevicollis MX1]|uniref:PEST proteolytic signal-containing nuclear protein n=1 Tax=Monosiga brevicollis TaxID=81824 RepID=A9UQY2_MONBE|nr:uncharacterized protein MONBRDRAFT_5424 [Monosiga brevicollis MX1]EDQ93125.1 predicted protein [Monosiga brevicollis MX1]|eukprot:XP_001742887.1 hypothetical protein [Monosiga brevicollis MX1]